MKVPYNKTTALAYETIANIIARIEKTEKELTRRKKEFRKEWAKWGKPKKGVSL